MTTLLPPFAEPAPGAAQPTRQAITALTRRPEPEVVAAWLPEARLAAPQSAQAEALARQLVAGVRGRESEGGKAGLVQNLLQEYALSSQEGIALMCLAEALLRIPDLATRDALIRDKISRGQWSAHLGRSPSLFVNAATWGLLVTGRLVATHSESGLSSALGRLLGLGGEPLVRKGVDLAMRMLGEQFVTGEHIGQALERAAVREAQGFRYSFDMLGEAAMTAHDAARYLADYEAAIHAIGQAAAGRGVVDGPGISIKLSALHPRYARAQQARVLAELYPLLVRLCALAQRYDIGLNIDAEEADRLELSLDLLDRLAAAPQLRGWQGLGFVVQAYQKRCPAVIDHVIALARQTGRRLMVRLVKGAYWDSEIKRAQQDGQAGYPVYTRKHHTDAAYLACARRLLAAPDAVYPQFATHNAHTLAAVHALADPARWAPGQYEFQCLHGMGEPLYEQVVGDAASGGLGRPCRIYAPVGTHETLLAYLVRRLLENGANTSFVNRLADASVPVDELVRHPVDSIDDLARREGAPGLPHPAIGLPVALYGPARANAQGLDLADEPTLARLHRALQDLAGQDLQAGALLAEPAGQAEPAAQAGSLHPPPPVALAVAQTPAAEPVLHPADRRLRVGQVQPASVAQVDQALASASAAAPAWAATPPAERAACLARAANALEADTDRLCALLVLEAGKTAGNAVAEVREAVDFLRYYAAQVQGWDAALHRPLGPVVCISPWNFPLAIFTGQVAAALAAGNTVLAKPAEQTPLVAAQAVQALWAAGVPRSALQLLPGDGATVGARLVADARVQGVLFTGSTEVARLLQQALVGRVGASGRAVPLVAETGGQNAMVVDSSALAEQVVADVISSAFDSAGQRCSALRVLCVQEEAADRVREMLLGAMAELRVGHPAELRTDVGPVIDEAARQGIEAHVAQMRAAGHRVHQACHPDSAVLPQGSFVLPTLVEIEHLSTLGREVFGPVLHLLRYRRGQLDALLAQVNATGYALTLGLHTRIDETMAQVAEAAHAGNLYINRNMVGAVVGVQPFGGEGLSGTGPKAGGPLYLYRLLAERPAGLLHTVLATPGPAPAAGVSAASAPATHVSAASAPAASAPVGVATGAASAAPAMPAALADLATWAGTTRPARPALAALCSALASRVPAQRQTTLPGPTGERNDYRLVPRRRVLCLAASDADRLAQLAAVLATGGHALWPTEPAADALWPQLPPALQSRVLRVRDWAASAVDVDAVLLHGGLDQLAQVQQQLAVRPGPVLTVERLAPGDHDLPLERLFTERSLSQNTAAAGGNAALMTLV